MIHAESELNRARLAACRADPAAGDLFTAAIATMRSKSTPYHLAHALLDHAELLNSSGHAEDARPLIDEAREIGSRLGAGPVVQRATSATLGSVSSTA